MNGLRQAGQICQFMVERAHRRPLFWLYNPFLVPAYFILPAVARVFHGTENYFDFSGGSEDWLNLNRVSIEAADMVICCSSGVARGFALHTRRDDVVVIPNGCDYVKYSRPVTPAGEWPARLAESSNAGRRLAVFAGNINCRMDFELMLGLAQRYPTSDFVYAGPIDSDNLLVSQRTAWNRLLSFPNVRTLGPLPPEDLPMLYRTCDVGIIPYRTDMAMVVENGFPLKALEMAAAGLPVVSTLMKPLLEVPEAITVTTSAEGFYAAFERTSRHSRTREAAEAADRVCRAYDYDRLFERMLAELAPRIPRNEAAPGHWAALASRVGEASYSTMLGQLAPPCHSVPLVGQMPTKPSAASRAIARQMSLLRTRVKRLLPLPLRRSVRRWITPAPPPVDRLHSLKLRSRAKWL
jgi:glycosyltransferase involved in cell wall biosynthesis